MGEKIHIDKRMACKIGKKNDRSDCARKDCEHCRHYVLMEFHNDCSKCLRDNPYCGNTECVKSLKYAGEKRKPYKK
jgi:hypothetical protein